MRWPHSQIKACFRNATLYAMEHKLHYVEGYATSMIACHHGWCLDTDDRVIEVTWKELGRAYYGVVFPPLRVKRGAVLFNEGNESVYRRRLKAAKEK